MYEFEERSLSRLLEQVTGAAVAVIDGVVGEFNSAAGRLLPDLREGARVSLPEPGCIELCGVQFEAESHPAGEATVYTFAVPARSAVADALPVLENMSRSIMESLSSSFAASELIAGMAEREQSESLQRYNAVLRHEQYRMLNIAENLHELCQLTGEGNALSPAEFDLMELCEDVAATARALVGVRGIEITVSPGCDDCRIYADKRRIERALLSLLANSAEACRDGGHIKLELRRDGGQYRLIVTDDGKGIAGNRYADVFDTFSMAMSPEHGPRGMGLSLAVARAVALRHGGSLIVDSAEGKGTRVMMTLPVNRPRSADVYSGRVIYAANPMREALAAFANVLDHSFYAPPYI